MRVFDAEWYRTGLVVDPYEGFCFILNKEVHGLSGGFSRRRMGEVLFGVDHGRFYYGSEKKEFVFFYGCGKRPTFNNFPSHKPWADDVYARAMRVCDVVVEREREKER